MTLSALYPTTESNRELYNFSGSECRRRHVGLIMEREEFEMPEAVALALELPVGCYVAGGFAAAYINGRTPARLDVYFMGDASFTETMKRVQYAPEGSFLHGYTQSKTAHAMVACGDGYLEFNHPSKPAILLVRTRWYQNATYLADNLALSCEQVALGSDLQLTFTNSALQDAKDKILKLMRSNWRVNTALELPKYQELGYRPVGSERYNDSFVRDFANHLKGYVSYVGHEPAPFTSY